MLPLTVPPCFYFQKGWIKEEESIHLGERFYRIRQPEICLQMVALGRKEELKLVASLGNEGGLGVVRLSERVELSLLTFPGLEVVRSRAVWWTSVSMERQRVTESDHDGRRISPS